jgi:hypothetical protein
MKMAVFWVVASCRLVWVYRRITTVSSARGFPHRPDDGGSTGL